MEAFSTENSFARQSLWTVVAGEDIQGQPERLVGLLARMVSLGSDATLPDVLERVKEGGLNGMSEQDLQSFVYLVLPQIITDSVDVSATIALADGIASSSAGTAVYTCFAAILNSLPQEKTPSDVPLTVLRHMLTIATKNDELSILSPFLDNIQTHLTSWQIQGEQLEQAILDVSAAQVQSGKRFEAQQLLLSFLSTSSLSTPTTQKLALELGKLSLSLPHFYSFYSLATLSCVSLLQKSDIWPILSPFIPQKENENTDIVKQVQQSVSSASSVLSQYDDLNAEKLVSKARCIALANLASHRVGQTISYADVKQVLGLESGDAEETIEGWVIEAIRSKLLMARINQLSQTIQIIRASPRSFTDEEWDALEQRLSSWRSTLDVMIETVDKVAAKQLAKENPVDGTGNNNSNNAQSEKVYIRAEVDVDDDLDLDQPEKVAA